MRIAVTGASGFIGKYVLRELLKTSHDIIAICRNPSSLDQDEYKSIQIYKYNIKQNNNNLFNDLGKPDHLIHLAWDGLPNYKSIFHFENELPSQFNFLKNLIKQGLHSLFISGTCLEYGDVSGCISADINTNPQNSYGFAKDSLRKQLELLKEELAFEFIWGRIFYLYGEGQSEFSLYSSLKNAVKRGDKVFNLSGGEQLRDFLHVRDVSNQIVNRFLVPKKTSIKNICSGEPISVRNLVEKWVKENNWDIKLNFGFYHYPDYEPLAFWGKI